MSLNTQWNEEGGGNAMYLDRHNVNCGSLSSALTRFQLQRNGSGKYRYDYDCKNVPGQTSVTSKDSGWNDEGGGNTIYLDRHNVNCGSNPINNFKLNRSGKNTFRYDYTCGNTSLVNIVNKNSAWNDEGGGNAIYLDRHNVNCDENSYLTRFQLKRDGKGKYRYEYSCGYNKTTPIETDKIDEPKKIDDNTNNKPDEPKKSDDNTNTKSDDNTNTDTEQTPFYKSWLFIALITLIVIIIIAIIIFVLFKNRKKLGKGIGKKFISGVDTISDSFKKNFKKTFNKN
jgi:hypothetical protein